MIRMIQSKSARHAKEYYSDALSKSDYYTSDQELPGYWSGRVAARLGLDGAATTKESFSALAENCHPVTGAKLTPRTDSNRTVGYDINFHCPKSVSLLHAFAGDDHVLEAFRASVAETMQEIEKDAKTRVWRKKGGRRVCEDMTTGELIWGTFIHQTARPVEGHLPDPHLHAHAFVQNVTWNAEEERFKAGQFRDIKRDMPYYQARFHMTLAQRLAALGYGIRRTEKSFEIEGVSPEAIALFSKRTDEIGRVAKEKGITDPAALGELGARTRGKKTKGLSMAELKAEWRAQIEGLGGSAIDGIDNPARSEPQPKEDGMTAEECVDFAIQHCFVRASVMSMHQIQEIAFRHALGSGVTAAEIAAAFTADERIIRVKDSGRMMCTTREVLREEKRMIALAREGRGAFAPLYREPPPLAASGQQARAISHVLTTTNQVSIIMGAAGSGKTTLMTEAVAKIEAAGTGVLVVAPTVDARDVLRESGFKDAETVAHLLLNKDLQAQLKGKALWVDEAGLLGTTDTLGIMELAKRSNARVIFGGDTRQHASVVRGDALRILNTVGGIRAAEVNKIYRQRDRDYRAAVEDLAKGKVREGFDKLDCMGAIVEADQADLAGRLVEDYIASVKAKKDTLVISPTHAQGQAITERIRQRLRTEGLLGKREVTIERLRNLNLTDAQKSDERNYRDGQVVQFSQNVAGFQRGSRWSVEETAAGIRLRNGEGDIMSLPTRHSDRFEVYAPEQLALSKGDKVRITHEGFDAQRKRLTNGQALDVVSVTKKEVLLKSRKGKTVFAIAPDFGHIAHGHCITSHASQGKTVDRVFIYQPEGTFAATDAKQFYVSISRGKEEARLYTDDKEGLLARASELGERKSAVELVGGRAMKLDFVTLQQRAEQNRTQHSKDKEHGIDR